MDFIFEQVRTGGDRNFGYLIGDRTAREAAVVDPSFTPEALVDRASAQGLAVRWIVNTHGHPDHTGGNDRARSLTGAAIAAHGRVGFRPDRALEEGSEIAVGSVRIRVLETPGHTRDHIVLWLPDQRIAVTGDHLFVGKVGGTSTDEAAREEWESLRRMLRELPDDTTIWPGHDYGCRPSSTLFLERLANPFLAAKSLDEFLDLKRGWAAFKARHGLR